MYLKKFLCCPFCILFLFYQFYNPIFLLSPQNGTSDHLDMCILKLSSLAFQGDNFLFYLLLVYVNNCKKNNSVQSHLLYFLILLYFGSALKQRHSDHPIMCNLKLSSLAFQDHNFWLHLLLIYVNNCTRNSPVILFVFFVLCLLTNV